VIPFTAASARAAASGDSPAVATVSYVTLDAAGRSVTVTGVMTKPGLMCSGLGARVPIGAAVETVGDGDVIAGDGVLAVECVGT
jgi:hypothetical protein